MQFHIVREDGVLPGLVVPSHSDEFAMGGRDTVGDVPGVEHAHVHFGIGTGAYQSLSKRFCEKMDSEQDASI